MDLLLWALPFEKENCPEADGINNHSFCYEFGNTYATPLLQQLERVYQKTADEIKDDEGEKDSVESDLFRKREEL